MSLKINTLNETHLHRTLKLLYQEQNPESQTEVQEGPFIADIRTKDGDIIEIQTGTLSSLAEKINYVIKQKHSIRIVYPLVAEKKICTANPVTGKSVTKKSPKKNTLYSVFRELTKLTPFLLNSKFYLDVLTVSVTEHRKVTEEPVQSKNKKRRYKKNWLKTGKELNTIKDKTVFHGRSAWKKLLPVKKGEIFSVNELYERIKTTENRATEEDIRIMIWVYVKAGILLPAGKEGNKKLYTLI